MYNYGRCQHTDHDSHAVEVGPGRGGRRRHVGDSGCGCLVDVDLRHGQVQHPASHLHTRMAYSGPFITNTKGIGYESPSSSLTLTILLYNAKQMEG